MNDRKLPRWVRNLALALLPAAMLITTAVVHADVPHAFKDGDTLSAQKLNDDFASLDGRLAALESAPQVVTVVEASSGIGQTGVYAQDLVYVAADLALPPGTWHVFGSASLYETGVDDEVALGLYDATHNVDLAGSTGAVAQVKVGFPTAFTTSRVIIVTSPTTVRLKAFRNGGSTVNFGNFGTWLKPLAPQKLYAVKIK